MVIEQDEIDYSDEEFPTESEPSPMTADHNEPSIGSDFEDEQTRAQLELIDDLERLGVKSYLDLPQVRWARKCMDSG